MSPHTNPQPLFHGKFYHIFNRGVNRENIFLERRNYDYFLGRYAHFIRPVADTFAYCLLKNHFHLLIRVKHLTDLTSPSGTDPKDMSGVSSASQAFSNFFNSYARTINKTYGRTGSLFQRPFGRIEVTSDAYFSKMIHYIHFNPQKHRFCSDFREYVWSSYQPILAGRKTYICKEEVLDWFGGKLGYEQYHNLQSDNGDSDFNKLIGDDF